MTRMIPTLVAAAALAAAGAASAETFTFGTPIAGTGPTTNFATLTVDPIGNGDDWRFTLAAGDLATIFGTSGAFIGNIAVDAPGAEGRNFGPGLMLTSVTGGVEDVRARNGGGPGGAFDFRISIGRGADRLTSGETTTFVWNDSGITSVNSFALHVQGLEDNGLGNSDSIWYGTSGTPPVPEPGSLAMMLAGGAAMLGIARRRAARDAA